MPDMFYTSAPPVRNSPPGGTVPRRKSSRMFYGVGVPRAVADRRAAPVAVELAWGRPCGSSRT
jgi:hypothetical protein